ncbi:LptA/OstA family protein [Bradyrhizobium sp. SYSU BS000235]|uniref:LptA/OstA family protein n=1 Tax=Bradyrhizobium sp. SYSU BS000235 TaxID=3411332 RepID=UPI003C70A905
MTSLVNHLRAQHLFRTKSRALFACLIAVALGGTQEAVAQSTTTGVPNAMQGFSQNRDKPIQIDAATLEMRDKDKAATFSGDVKVVQGDTTMRCKTLVVFYDNDQSSSGAKPAMKSATPGPTGSSSIRKLEARGGVVVTQKDSTVTGDTGVFDMRANTVTMVGNVLLTKEKNVLKGDRLVVDLTTGVSRVESKSRVQGVFQASPSNGSPGGGIVPAPGRDAQPGKPLKLNNLNSSSRRPG